MDHSIFTQRCRCISPCAISKNISTAASPRPGAGSHSKNSNTKDQGPRVEPFHQSPCPDLSPSTPEWHLVTPLMVASHTCDGPHYARSWSHLSWLDPSLSQSRQPCRRSSFDDIRHDDAPYGYTSLDYSSHRHFPDTPLMVTPMMVTHPSWPSNP